MHVRSILRMRVVVAELDATRVADLERTAAVLCPRLLRLKFAADRAPEVIAANYQRDVATSIGLRIMRHTMTTSCEPSGDVFGISRALFFEGISAVARA